MHTLDSPSPPPRESIRVFRFRLRFALTLVLLGLAALSPLVTSGRAQPADASNSPLPHPVGHINISTHIVLRPVAPVYEPRPAPAVVAVPRGANLTLETFATDSALTGVRWFKNGAELPTTAKKLVLNKATAADSGVYTAHLLREVEPAVLYGSATEQIRIEVGELKARKLINISTRVTIDESNPTVVMGFVIDRNPAQPHGLSYFLIRAVGPTLADFGVENPLAVPRVTLFNAQGQKIDWPEIYIPEIDPHRLAQTLAPAVGATPLPPGRKDFAILQSLPPGAYTLHVTSADGDSGDVVLEVFEVPTELVPVL